MKKKIILGILIVIVVIFTGMMGIDLSSKTDWYISKFGQTISISKGPNGERIVIKTSPKRQTRGQIIPVENGWSQYTSDASDEWDFTFSYPSNWELTEKNGVIFLRDGQFQSGGELESVLAEGDGYTVHFNNIGRGYPAAQATVTEYVVSGEKKRAFEDKFGDVFWQAMGACDVSLEISRPAESKEITDRIIDSVICL